MLIAQVLAMVRRGRPVIAAFVAPTRWTWNEKDFAND